jgi:ATP-dependent Lon protease
VNTDPVFENGTPNSVELNDEDESGMSAIPVEAVEGHPGTDDEPPIPATLPVLAIRETVAFPGTVMPLNVGREKSKRVLDLALAGDHLIGVFTQRTAELEDPRLNDLYRIGTACRILKMFKLPDGTETILVHGIARVGLENLVKETPHLEATVHAYQESAETTTEIEALVHTVRQAAERIIELSPNVPEDARVVLRSIKKPGGVADFLAANLPLGVVHKQELLETFDVAHRLRKINAALAGQLEILELSQKIQTQVRAEMDKSQRDYYLREQLKAIQHELGTDDARTAQIEGLRTKVRNAGMPEAVGQQATREIERLTSIPQASPEYSVTLDYIEWLCALPWQVMTEDQHDIHRAQEILNADHYGLEKIKKRILEFLAVRQLKPDGRGPILCFAGPPGVGKTSLGRSIARALGRKFIRISLGGMRDEADIRGHRRTYIGALPGRIMQELRKAASRNPVFMLDEVDKLGQDFRGDPSAALLEVLDPEQNNSFTDHYLDVPFDLSRVLFIATANYMDEIPPPLRDRMEVIQLSGYTSLEKVHIARDYLVPRQLEQHGLTPARLQIPDKVLARIISDYTREAGVRTLERKIAAICRTRAVSIVQSNAHPAKATLAHLVDDLGPPAFEPEVASRVAVPGVVTGLAFTPAGGEILFVEATRMAGNGSLNLTGQIGAVMRESAQAAYSIVRSQAARLGLDEAAMRQSDFHIHVPAGAIPKDGPSAGVAMLTALVSLLTGQTVNPKTGMTGEITLRGSVLPIGGVKEKVIAAHRAGLTRIILPDRNVKDLDDVPAEVRNEIQFVFVKTIDDLFAAVFGEETPQAKKSGKAGRKSTPRRTPPTASARASARPKTGGKLAARGSKR